MQDLTLALCFLALFVTLALFDPRALCYSFGPFRYMRKGWGKPFYIKEGYLPGAASTAVIDHHGGVTVLLTAGHPEADAPGWKQFYAKLHHALEGYYAKKHFD